MGSRRRPTAARSAGVDFIAVQRAAGLEDCVTTCTVRAALATCSVLCAQCVERDAVGHDSQRPGLEPEPTRGRRRQRTRGQDPIPGRACLVQLEVRVGGPMRAVTLPQPC